MANGFGFAGGLARGLQRSFPDVGGIMREERVREEEKRKQQQEKEEKRLLDTARVKAQENMQAADDIIETAKSGLTLESLDQKELADLKKMYVSFVQNANLDRAMLGLGPIPGHSTDGSTFDLAVQNIETESQRAQRELGQSIAKEKGLRPEKTETARVIAETRAQAQTEAMQQRQEQGLSGQSTRLSASVSNSIRAASARLFGGITDPLTGDFVGIDQAEVINAMRVAARGDQIAIENPNVGANDAALRAFDELRAAQNAPPPAGTIPGQQPGVGAALPAVPEDRVSQIMQQQPNIPRERAEELARQMGTQQAIPTPQAPPSVPGESMFSSRLGRVVSQADFEDTVDDIMQQQPNLTRERAVEIARQMLQIR
jgi:hypothetical protein